MARLGSPAPAPDGSFVVAPLTTYDVEENRGVSRLWLFGDGEPRVLTTDSRTSTNPVVSPDGSSVAFIGKTVGEDKAVAQAYVMPLTGGEASAVTDFPHPVASLKWMPDGRRLVAMTNVYRDAVSLEAASKRKQQIADSKVTGKVTEERMYRFWDRWLTDGEVAHLFLVDLTGGEPTDLTPDLMTYIYLMDGGAAFDISPDGEELAFQATVAHPDEDRFLFGLFTAPIAGGPATRLSEHMAGHEIAPVYSPDGRFLLFGRTEKWHFYADKVRLTLRDRASGDELVLNDGWDRSPFDWSFHGDEVVFAAEDNARVNLYSVPTVNPGEPTLVAAGGTVGSVRLAGNWIYYLQDSLTHPAQLKRVDPASGEVERLDTSNDDILSELDLAEVSEYSFPGADGAQIQAFLLHPPGFDPNKKWPLVHQIHGGPHGVFGDGWHWRWNAQVFAAPGYVVTMVNFHGSTSWGQDFAEVIRGSWGDKPTQDILAATDHLVETGYVDPDRMVIAGGSYGGYLAAWLTMQTSRFAAAVVHAGVTNFLAKYAGDVTSGLEQTHGGLPWDGLDRVLEWSPTAHTENLTTPTLVIHGERDYRVTIDQGLELYGILKAKGVESRLLYYPDEGHWILKPQNSLQWYQEFLAWLDRHLG